MKKYNLFLYVIFGLFLVSCAEEDSHFIKDYDAPDPGGITNIVSEERPGKIFIKWDKENNALYDYVRVTYKDPNNDNKEVLLTASRFADSILIPKTFQKYGEYSFKLQPFNRKDKGGKVYDFKATSGKAPSDTIFVTHDLTLQASNLETNASEPREGSLAETLDGNTETYFHSNWSGASPDVHYFQVNLDKALQAFKFTYGTRNNGRNYPTAIRIEGSNVGGGEWEEITTISSGLATPNNAFARYNSEIIVMKKPFKKIRFNVTKTNDGSKWFVFSEFGMWDVELNIIDPEKI